MKQSAFKTTFLELLEEQRHCVGTSLYLKCFSLYRSNTMTIAGIEKCLDTLCYSGQYNSIYTKKSNVTSRACLNSMYYFVYECLPQDT